MKQVRKKARGFVYVNTGITKEAHAGLKRIAADRGLTLQDTTRVILEWAGGEEVEDLIKLGVRLPIYDSDLGREPI